MQVIGTAGHVDHGKSALIEALTGIHPDRLREEREREMTIVLGFAWLTLPDGKEVGIVDVPGHRDFIENMLSGIGAIDAALFVIAADEGVMPQTREHLAILDLLQIQGGAVALTKMDIVDDPEWVDLVETDILDTLQGTVLESAPIVRVSAKTGKGIKRLQEVLMETLEDKPHRPDLGRPRLPIDRVFTMSGFGTVVTGTLTDGHFSVGDEVQIMPQQIRGRIRGLQTHKRKEETAFPGSRTAINISGIDVDQVQRGDVVVHPETYPSTRRMDVHFHLLADSSTPMKHNTEVKLFIASSEVIARARLLGAEILKPGDTGWLQLELTKPVVAIRGDRYIIRRPSPGETIGGGMVVDPSPKGRHKRFQNTTIKRLDALLDGTPADILLQAVLETGITTIGGATTRSSLEPHIAAQALDELLQDDRVVFLDAMADKKDPNTLVAAMSYWSQLVERIMIEIDGYLESHPLRLGIPREVLKNRINLSTRAFNQAVAKLSSQGEISETRIRQDLPGVSALPVIFKPGHEIRLNEDQRRTVDHLMTQFSNNPYAPPTIKSCIDEIGEDLYNALVDTGRVIPVSGEVVFRWEDYQEMVAQLIQMIETSGSISVAQVRDHFKTSRRYILALLEHLDSIGTTIRKGDVRVLKE